VPAFDNAAIVASLSRIARRNGGHAPRRVLVADDDPHVHDMVRQLVGDQFELRVAADGVDALAAIERERPDAILPTLGGQTGLNLAMDLFRQGVLAKYNVEMIGARAAMAPERR